MKRAAKSARNLAPPAFSSIFLGLGAQILREDLKISKTEKSLK